MERPCQHQPTPAGGSVGPGILPAVLTSRAVFLLAWPLLLAAASACDADGGAAPSQTVAPVSGEQLDQMQQAARTAGLGAAERVHVLRPDDGRVILHARLSRDLDRSAQTAICSGARAALAGELLPGQELEIYLVQPETVTACP